MQRSLPNPSPKDDDEVHQGEIVPFDVLRPEDSRQQSKLSISGIALVRSHAGPLPMPEHFAEYEKAVPVFQTIAQDG